MVGDSAKDDVRTTTWAVSVCCIPSDPVDVEYRFCAYWGTLFNFMSFALSHKRSHDKMLAVSQLNTSQLADNANTGDLQVVAGNRAGMDTILLDTNQSYQDQRSLQGELKPTHIVTSLAQIPELLQTEYFLHGMQERVSAKAVGQQ